MEVSKKNTVLKWSALGISIAFILFGISRGEAASVLQKAIQVCLECIGIG